MFCSAMFSYDWLKASPIPWTSLIGGIGKKKVQNLSKNFPFQAVKFYSFWSSKALIRIRNRIDLKCCIRIRVETNEDPQNSVEVINSGNIPLQLRVTF